MIDIIKFQYKLLLAEKATLIYIGFIFAVCTVVPFCWPERFFAFVSILSLNFVVQIGPRLFVGEKENDTLETLLSTPYRVETIFMGKTLFCFSILCIMFFASIGVTALSSVIFHLVIFSGNRAETVINVVLIPFAFFAASYHSAYTSLKSDDSKVCAVKLIEIMILYAVLVYFVLTVFTVEPKTVAIGLILLYIIVTFGILVILHFKIRKILKKSIIFSRLGRIS